MYTKLVRLGLLASNISVLDKGCKFLNPGEGLGSGPFRLEPGPGLRFTRTLPGERSIREKWRSSEYLNTLPQQNKGMKVSSQLSPKDDKTRVYVERGCEWMSK